MEKLYILNPYNSNHINLLMDYEQEHKVSTKSLESIMKVRETLTEEEYKQLKKNANEIELSIFTEESGRIKDLCFIQGENDIRTCKLFFSPAPENIKTRKLLNLATDFALNTLGMESVFVITAQDDKKMHTNLENCGYESLGLENGSIIYLKERELEIVQHKHQ